MWSFVEIAWPISPHSRERQSTRASAGTDEQAFGPDEPRLFLARSIFRCKDGS
jgi:hypothetical protein